MRNFVLPRRTFLHGLGAALALPPLEAMARSGGKANAIRIPLRMGFAYVPNGVILPSRPTKSWSIISNSTP